MWKVSLSLLVTFVIVGVASAKAGECLIDSEAPVFDSLILSGDVDAAVRMLNSVESEYLQQGDLARAVDDCHALHSQLEEILAYVDYAAAQPAAYVDSLVRRVMLEESSYTEESGGVSSAAAFAEFKRQIEIGENLQVAKWYRIARFFRDAFVAQAADEIEVNISLAREYYRQGQYREASDIIVSTVIPPSQNKRLASLADSLQDFDRALQQRLVEQKRFELSWGSTEPVEKLITIVIGASLVFRPQLEETNLILSNQNVIADVSLQKIPATWTGGGSLECMLPLTKVVQVGLGLGFDSYDINTPEVTEPVYFSIDMRHYSIALLGRYYSRELVGLRPYVTLGVGATRFERKAADVTILLKYSEDSQNYSVERFDLEGRSFTSATLVVEYGVEYSPGAGRGIVTAPTVSLNYNFKGDRFIRQTNLAVSFKIGYKL